MQYLITLYDVGVVFRKYVISADYEDAVLKADELSSGLSEAFGHTVTNSVELVDEL